LLLYLKVDDPDRVARAPRHFRHQFETERLKPQKHLGIE
jgi:hypothetical protein